MIRINKNKEVIALGEMTQKMKYHLVRMLMFYWMEKDWDFGVNRTELSNCRLNRKKRGRRNRKIMNSWIKKQINHFLLLLQFHHKTLQVRV